MNKKLFLGMFAAAGMLLATSCSNDELDAVQSSNDAQITFSIGAEGGIATRAISDGKKAKTLVWAVYNEAGTLLNVFENNDGEYEGQKTETVTVDMTQTAHEVTVNLAKGQKYNVLFWAQDPSCKAYDTKDLRAVKVSYKAENGTDNAVNNDETRDAFFACKKIEVKGNETFKVDLKRPFAQINVGVTDADWKAAEASGIVIEKSTVVIKNAANEIDLLDGSVSGSESVTYALAQIPHYLNTSESLKVDLNDDDDTDDDGETFKYLSMSYILADDKSGGSNKANLESLEFTFVPKSGNNIVFSEGLNNVPVQRNWRTNIIGQILTGTIKFEVKIDNNFIDDYNVTVERDETNKITTINGVQYKDGQVMYGTPNSAFTDANTLEDAISKAPDGSIITLGAGANVDLSNKIIQIQKPVTISGIDAEESTIVGAFCLSGAWSGPGDNYKNPTVTFENLTIKWNAASGSEGPIVMKNEGNPTLIVENCVLDGNNNSIGNAQGLIYLQKSYRVKIDNCTFKGNKGTCWAIQQTITGTSDNHATITNCKFQTGGLLLTAGNGNVKYLEVKGNEFLNTVRGLKIDPVALNNSWEYVWIENNKGKFECKWNGSTKLSDIYVKGNETAEGKDWTIPTNSGIITNY